MDGIFYHQPAWQPPTPKLTALFLAMQEVSYRQYDAADEIYREVPEEYPFQHRIASNAVQMLLANTPAPPAYVITYRSFDAQVVLHEENPDAETDTNFMTYYRQPRRLSADLFIDPPPPPGPTGGFYHRRRFGSLR